MTSNHSSSSSSSSSSSTSSRDNKSIHGKCNSSKYISSGTFKNVAKGYYDQGERIGQAFALKTLKTGSVYSKDYFKQEMSIVEQALIFVSEYNKLKIVNKLIRLNKPQIWTKENFPYEQALVEVI